jgi:hypothetical protein
VVKQSERDAENSPLSNMEFQYCRESNSTPPCAFVPCREKILTEYFLCICIVCIAGVSNFAVFRLDFLGLVRGTSQSVSQSVSLSVCLPASVSDLISDYTVCRICMNFRKRVFFFTKTIAQVIFLKIISVTGIICLKT